MIANVEVHFPSENGCLKTICREEVKNLKTVHKSKVATSDIFFIHFCWKWMKITGFVIQKLCNQNTFSIFLEHVKYQFGNYYQSGGFTEFLYTILQEKRKIDRHVK